MTNLKTRLRTSRMQIIKGIIIVIAPTLLILYYSHKLDRLYFYTWYSNFRLKHSMQVLLKDIEPSNGFYVTQSRVYKMKNGIEIEFGNIEAIPKYNESQKVLDIYVTVYKMIDGYYSSINNLITDDARQEVANFVYTQIYQDVLYCNQKDYTKHFINSMVFHFISDEAYGTKGNADSIIYKRTVRSKVFKKIQ